MKKIFFRGMEYETKCYRLAWSKVLKRKLDTRIQEGGNSISKWGLFTIENNLDDSQENERQTFSALSYNCGFTACKSPYEK